MNIILKSYSIIICIFFLAGCNKGLTETQCRQNLHYFKQAANVLKSKEAEMLETYKYIEDSNYAFDNLAIKNLFQEDTSSKSIFLLWDKSLIAPNKSIYYNSSENILFVLPQKNVFVVYDPLGEYPNTCGISDKTKHLLEKDWYYLYACED